ncbi:MAG TPA: double-strand break repair protein AddB [Rhizomicrobium sp.]|nr:double-strand break repair protein AddB [Rhizomicrobium sp.]
MKRPAVFTIAASAAFAETLAKGLIARLGDDPLALSSAVIYLPTRRAARNFGEAFAAVLGGATLLPQFKPLGDSGRDSEDDELLLADDDLELAPPIAPLRRQLLLARLIRQWDRSERGGQLSFAQCAALANSLARLMDEVETQDCDLSRWKDLAPAELAEHWQGVSHFLDVLQQAWPAVLEAEQAMNPAARRVQALRALAQRLQAAPPSGMVIAAGSTGSIPATAELLSVIARLPQGAVVLPGLDRTMDDESWNTLDIQDQSGHPQFGLRQLLRTIGADREDVKDWIAAETDPAREILLRETLRPAPTTDAWRELADKGGGEIEKGLRGLALIEAADPAQEGLAIALALREALETPGRTAALVTPDRNLARRVAAEMARWNILLDDSAGRPLAHTAAGTFLCLLAEAAQARFAPVPLLALLKHPFARRGLDSAEFRARARELDRWCLRGPRPDPGLAGIANAIAKAGEERTPPAGLAQLAGWWEEIAKILVPLEQILAQPDALLENLLETQLTAAEALACDERGACLLWAAEDGEAALALTAELKLAAENLDAIEPGSWPALFRSLAMKVPVRAQRGQHPRLAILGPLEARLQRFDLVILGGLNEGSWPRGAQSDPWFSRPMRASLGLEQPERGIGLSAHDFAMLAAGPCVLLTRALKAEGAPTIASRWLQRLEQLTRGLQLREALAPKLDYAQAAARLMDVPQGPRLPRPAPTPPVEARPRKLSVTEIETWLRDPYAIYARHVLGLKPLEAIDEPTGPLERGTALHKALEIFIAQHQDGLPDDAAARLTAIADRVFDQAGIPKAALAVWRPRFAAAARGFVDFERERRADITASHLEIRGKLTLGGFTLTGIADRIDILQNGSAAILDYKTGAAPSQKQVTQLLSPQLPLEGAMLAADGFDIGAHIAEQLIYLSLASEKKARDPQQIEGAVELAQEAVAQLSRRIAWFQEPATAYRPRVRPYRADIAGDYDHLARVREWSPSGWTEE